MYHLPHSRCVDVSVNHYLLFPSAGRVQLIDASLCNTTTRCPPSMEASTITLDDLPAIRPDVRSVVVKLDAEGYERKVIQGADVFWTKVQASTFCCYVHPDIGPMYACT